MKQKIYIFILIGFGLMGNAQVNDLARVEYTFLPQNGSDLTYERLRALFNIPVKVKEESYLFFGADYSTINLNTEQLNFDDSEFDEFQILEFNLGYTYKMSEFWRFAGRLTPGISSSFNDKLTNGDFTLSASALFINDHTKDQNVKKPYRLILGVSFAANSGFNFPLPFINYHRQFHPKWSYSLGIPKTRIRRTWTDQHKTELYVGIDGFNSNIQKSTLFSPQGNRAETARMRLLVGGFGHDFNLTKHLVLYGKTAYILNQNTEIQDDDGDAVFDYDQNNNFYFRFGVKFKI